MTPPCCDDIFFDGPLPYVAFSKSWFVKKLLFNPQRHFDLNLNFFQVQIMQINKVQSYVQPYFVILRYKLIVTLKLHNCKTLQQLLNLHKTPFFGPSSSLMMMVTQPLIVIISSAMYSCFPNKQPIPNKCQMFYIG